MSNELILEKVSFKVVSMNQDFQEYEGEVLSYILLVKS